MPPHCASAFRIICPFQVFPLFFLVPIAMVLAAMALADKKRSTAIFFHMSVLLHLSHVSIMTEKRTPG